LSAKISRLEKKLGEKYSFDSIIGHSKKIKAAKETGLKVAVTDTAVLLTGETGTGKEVFAHAIHEASNRNKNNFIAINCAAFNRDLLENEMFGHKAGAFTGASKDTKGIFEEANNGTVFLDEIGEMPLELQAKLLRVLESGELMRLGENKPIKVNVRIIAATHRDLQKLVEEGQFRQDLYYRIAVFQISLPPLRERVSDIEAFARHFLANFNTKTNKKIDKISTAYLEALKQHEWQGNIRELKNILERSVILTETDQLETDSLPAEWKYAESGNATHQQLSAFDLASAEKIHIRKVLNYTGGNKTEAARLLNIALTTLYRKLEDYNIS
jgi:two-component system NtrC family response regulator